MFTNEPTRATLVMVTQSALPFWNDFPPRTTITLWSTTAHHQSFVACTESLCLSLKKYLNTNIPLRLFFLAFLVASTFSAFVSLLYSFTDSFSAQTCLGQHLVGCCLASALSQFFNITRPWLCEFLLNPYVKRWNRFFYIFILTIFHPSVILFILVYNSIRSSASVYSLILRPFYGFPLHSFICLFLNFIHPFIFPCYPSVRLYCPIGCVPFGYHLYSWNIL